MTPILKVYIALNEFNLGAKEQAAKRIKKARVLQQVPTDASLPDGCAEPDVESFLAGS